MNQARQPALQGRSINEDRRKRLGQYFTGIGLGRVLAALAQAEKAKSILDPMAGSGDLLAACLEIGAKPIELAGIEIDAEARSACLQRLPEADCVLGSAFDPEAISRLPRLAWDLVIGNPPYVRYQSFSDKADPSHALPSAMQIRTGLLQAVALLPALDAEDKELFAHLVSGYSGLSDLAVPSWILCAGLVKLGGRLALVVPESWLTRDYAAVVHYLLFRWFDIEFIVEDEHASWFDDAQVKATLVVAKRVKRRPSALGRPDSATYCHISISAAAASPQSPIGRLPAGTGRSVEHEFAKQARKWSRSAAQQSTGLVSSRPVSLRLACRNAIASASSQKWFAAMGEAETAQDHCAHVPHTIHDWLTRRGLAPTFNTLESEGIAVGQGLRTGANGFFYADGIREGNQVVLSFSGPLSGRTAVAAVGVVKPVLRRQAELPSGYVVQADHATGWALDLRRHALTEDMDVAELFSAPYERMPDSIAALVREAGRVNFGSKTKPQKVWELTAVSPNVRPAARGLPARYWYMLPDFAPRHLPDLLLARVNASTPKAYLNSGRSCLVDANFSTIWVQPDNRWSPHALLAFMNSAWAQAVIETSGAVMGGGALKVEATHLRRLPLPQIGSPQVATLNEFGAKLAAAGSDAEPWLVKIDEVVGEALGCGAGGMAELRRIAQEGQARRANHNRKRGAEDGGELC
jgi:hypothetical protein